MFYASLDSISSDELSIAVSLRTQLTVKQCCMISTDSIYIILLLLTFIIIKVIIFRYFNIIIVLVIANYREIESPSNLQHHTILQMSAFSMAISSEEFLSDDEFKCELT